MFLRLLFLHLVLMVSLCNGDLWASGTYEQLKTVYQQTRSATEDVIYLRNNDVLRGEVLNQSLSITTPYGEMTVPLRKCAGVSFEGSRANTESLATVNFNRFTGIIRDQVINFRISTSNTVIPVRKEKIKYILFKINEAEKSYLKDKKTDLFLMANGDLLTGLPDTTEIVIVTDYGRVPVSFGEISSLEMQGGDNVTAIVKKKNNDVLKGVLETESVGVKLELDLFIPAIYKDKFSQVNIDDGMSRVAAAFNVMQPQQGESDGALSKSITQQDEKNLVIDLAAGAKLEMVFIRPGEFQMGSVYGQGEEREHPQHKVTITKGFYLSKYEITQAQWHSVMGFNPSKFRGDSRPVEQVSWDECQAFTVKLSEKFGRKFRLPTEAECEYACRAGTDTTYYWNGNPDVEYMWYDK
ncbi:MAG: formylglycine-generating enzyme family protein, partial [Candidatus Wallbacteria bacterium]|nr:formylglycine-generating enzyme family protein [Candidatus Wallbacteria bacterium]